MNRLEYVVIIDGRHEACLSLFQKILNLVSGLTFNHPFFRFPLFAPPSISQIVNIELIDELQNNIYS